MSAAGVPFNIFAMEYHLEPERLRVTMFFFVPLWSARYADISSVEVLARSFRNWRKTLGNAQLGYPSLSRRREVVLIRKRGAWFGAVLTPPDPREFADEVRRRAGLDGGRS